MSITENVTYTVPSPTTPATPVRTLRQGPFRLANFVLLITANPRIHAEFKKLGWSKRDVATAFSLLHAVAGPDALPPEEEDNPVTHAVKRCEEAQDTVLVVARAALGLEHREYIPFLFQNMLAGKGIQAVLSVSMFIDQIDALESGPERKKTRKADHAVLAYLEQRGITKAVVKQMRADVAAARDTDLALPADDGAYLENLQKIHDWLASWSEMARTVITGRADLIRLGLAKRRTKKTKPVFPVPAPAPVPVPAPPVVPAVSTSPLTLVTEDRGPDSRAA